MMIQQCDRCGVKIKYPNVFLVGAYNTPKAELCETCFKPFLSLMKEQGILGESADKTLPTTLSSSL